MNDKRVNQYLILPEAGQRKDTKLAVEYDEAQIADYLSQGYVIVGSNDFNKLIGNGDGKYLIADDGSVYPKPAPTDAELLAVAKPAKIAVSILGRRSVFTVKTALPSTSFKASHTSLGV